MNPFGWGPTDSQNYWGPMIDPWGTHGGFAVKNMLLPIDTSFVFSLEVLRRSQRTHQWLCVATQMK